jgi:hypothetical protein
MASVGDWACSPLKAEQNCSRPARAWQSMSQIVLRAVGETYVPGNPPLQSVRNCLQSSPPVH